MKTITKAETVTLMPEQVKALWLSWPKPDWDCEGVMQDQWRSIGSGYSHSAVARACYRDATSFCDILGIGDDWPDTLVAWAMGVGEE